MWDTTFMWHPAGAARQYEAAGSRTSFEKRWNAHQKHTAQEPQEVSDALQFLIEVLRDEEKARWLQRFDPTGVTRVR